VQLLLVILFKMSNTPSYIASDYNISKMLAT